MILSHSSVWFSTVVFLCCSFILSGLVLGLSVALVFQQPDFEKNSAYECGFMPFSDTRQQFEIRFYLISILFIIFDLEVSFLIPWSICLFDLSLAGIFFGFAFLWVLVLGIIYEWRKGALDWL